MDEIFVSRLREDNVEYFRISECKEPIDIEFRDFSLAIPFMLLGDFQGIVLYGRHLDDRRDLDDVEKNELQEYVHFISSALESIERSEILKSRITKLEQQYLSNSSANNK